MVLGMILLPLRSQLSSTHQSEYRVHTSYIGLGILHPGTSYISHPNGCICYCRCLVVVCTVLLHPTMYQRRRSQSLTSPLLTSSFLTSSLLPTLGTVRVFKCCLLLKLNQLSKEVLLNHIDQLCLLFCLR